MKINTYNFRFITMSLVQSHSLLIDVPVTIDLLMICLCVGDRCWAGRVC